jgi:AcrR family transcriptional regulator
MAQIAEMLAPMPRIPEPVPAQCSVEPAGLRSPPAPRAQLARGRKEETQERIVGAALALFAERGYERASISAIAGHARVSRSAVFWHFGDKEGLFRETFRRMLVPFFGELQSSLGHIPPRERVFEILAAYERVVGENEDAIRSIVRWLLESEKLRATLLETLFALHDTLMGDIRDTLIEGGGDAEGSPALGAALVAMLDGNLLLALLDPNARNRELRREGLRRLTQLALGAGGG